MQINNTEQIAIVGAGQAADQAIHTLRRRGFAGRLVLVGDEPHPPYQRPPLSKKFLAGSLERARLSLRHQSFYADHSVDTRLGRRVMQILRPERRLYVDDGSKISYDALLLATGSKPRTLAVPGATLTGIHYLRSIADVDAIRSSLETCRHVVVIGGGFIGLEVAATCRELGRDVTVLEMTERVLGRVTCPELSRFYEREHASRGVRVFCGTRVHAFSGDPSSGRVRSVITAEGAVFPADLVVVGVGVLACDDLAIDAELECANGIIVNERCQTSDEAIYAAGDCTLHPSVRYGRHVRLESVDNAYEQGTSAAHNILGFDTMHDKVPWFWSDQYDHKLVIIGLSHGYDHALVRGDSASGRFSVCYLKQGELIAVDTVNRPGDQMAARRLVALRTCPDLAKLADPTIPLAQTV